MKFLINTQWLWLLSLVISIFVEEFCCLQGKSQTACINLTFLISCYLLDKRWMLRKLDIVYVIWTERFMQLEVRLMTKYVQSYVKSTIFRLILGLILVVFIMEGVGVDSPPLSLKTIRNSSMLSLAQILCKLLIIL